MTLLVQNEPIALQVKETLVVVTAISERALTLNLVTTPVTLMVEQQTLQLEIAELPVQVVVEQPVVTVQVQSSPVSISINIAGTPESATTNSIVLTNETGTRYRIGVALDSDSELPTLTFTELG